MKVFILKKLLLVAPFLSIGLILFTVSCKQDTAERVQHTQQKSTAVEERSDEVSINPDAQEHQTFNETIDSLPANLQQFIIKGYSVINFSSGDANLDGIEDIILVLRKNGEEKTSDFNDGKPDKRPL